ncbi:MAG: hypothetical protein AB8E15_03540 [Bdellovibrionales bacterium]
MSESTLLILVLSISLMGLVYAWKTNSKYRWKFSADFVLILALIVFERNSVDVFYRNAILLIWFIYHLILLKENGKKDEVSTTLE